MLENSNYNNLKSSALYIEEKEKKKWLSSWNGGLELEEGLIDVFAFLISIYELRIRLFGTKVKLIGNIIIKKMIQKKDS